MQIWAESGKSALPICNYSQILYQFLTFTQNLKRSRKLFAIFSYLLSGDEYKAVIKTLESKSPAITPFNGQYQTTGSILLF